MSSTFIKKQEDFTCAKCGFLVTGDGFTNHCPRCLYSLHVDINPGDRASLCGGLMEPITVEGTQKEYFVIHKCKTCGYKKRNKVSKNDSFDTLTSVARNNKI